MAANLAIIVKAKDEASGVLGRISGKAGAVGSGLGKAFKAGAVGIGVAGVALGGFLATSVKAAMEQQRVEKQLEAVLKSTKNAAGLSKQQLLDMAAGLQKVTTFGDEAIVTAQNVLLTFTQIKGPQFEGATKAVLDMSTALGTDLKSASILVGKALNDPIKGVTALQRSGVQLTEEQKKQVKAAVEAGDTWKAQRIILGELETQFGGSAAAAADTFGGRMEQLKNAFGDVQERIGMALMPVLTKLMLFLLNVGIPAFDKVASYFQTFISALRDPDQTSDGFHGKLERLALFIHREALPIVREGARVFKEDLLPAIKEVAMFVAREVIPRYVEFELALARLVKGIIVAWVIPAVEELAEAWQQLSPILARYVLPILEKVGGFLDEHKEILAGLALVIIGITNPWLLVVAALVIVLAKWDEIKELFTKTIPAAIDHVITKIEEIPIIGAIFKAALETVKLTVETAFRLIEARVQFFMDAIRGIILIVTGLIKGDWGRVWEGLRTIFSGTWELIKSDISTAFGGVAGIIGIALGGVAGVVGGVWELVKGSTQGALNWIIARINEFTSGLNNILNLGGLGSLFKKATGVDITPSIPAIPYVGGGGGSTGGTRLGNFDVRGFQHGGLVTRPTIGLLGEAGPEAVVPLNRLSDDDTFIDRFARALARELAAVSIQVDGREIGRIASGRMGYEASMLGRGG